jgi:hypothetical protein
MKATVIKEFPGRPDREVLARTIKAGEVIDGELAAVAVRAGWAEEMKAEEPAPASRGGDDLGKLTVAELEALADERGVDLAGVHRKADIIAVLAAGAARAAEG